MNKNVEKWVYEVVSGFISGGAASVVSGLTTMGFAPDKFNLTTISGFWHLLVLVPQTSLSRGRWGRFFICASRPCRR